MQCLHECQGTGLTLLILGSLGPLCAASAPAAAHALLSATRSANRRGLSRTRAHHPRNPNFLGGVSNFDQCPARHCAMLLSSPRNHWHPSVTESSRLPPDPEGGGIMPFD